MRSNDFPSASVAIAWRNVRSPANDVDESFIVLIVSVWRYAGATSS